MSWSAEQCRLLDALGYERFVVGTAGAVSGASVAAPAKVGSPTHAYAAAAPATTAALASGRLLEALRRAANGADPAALVDDLERLRRDPALKRALWPRLRALRRSH